MEKTLEDRHVSAVYLHRCWSCYSCMFFFFVFCFLNLISQKEDMIIWHLIADAFEILKEVWPPEARSFSLSSRTLEGLSLLRRPPVARFGTAGWAATQVIQQDSSVDNNLLIVFHRCSSILLPQFSFSIFFFVVFTFIEVSHCSNINNGKKKR